MKDILAIFGVILIGTTIFFLLVMLWEVIKDLFHTLKIKYIIKHRFDKPPTAKCYCQDCVRHNNESNKCYKFDGWYTADDWFCWDAEPRKEVDNE